MRKTAVRPRIIRMPGILLLACSLLSGAALFAREYSVFGEIELEGSFASIPENEAGEDDNLLESVLGIEANHRLDYEAFSFIARHRAEIDGNEEIHHDLYEAYLDYPLGTDGSISAGKQRIPWGRGIAFFPTDTLHPSHTRDDVEGFSGFSLILNPSLNFQIAGALDFTEALKGESPDSNQDFYREMKYALYVSLLTGTADLALSGVYSPDGTVRPGIGISYDIAGFILTAEGALELNNTVEYPNAALTSFETSRSFRPLPLVSAGISRSISPRTMPDLSLMFVNEYLHAGTGYDKDERKEYFSIISDYRASGGEAPEIEYLGRNYLFASASLELYQRFSLELSAYMSIDDASTSYSGTATLLGIPDMDLSLEGELLTGDQPDRIRLPEISGRRIPNYPDIHGLFLAFFRFCLSRQNEQGAVYAATENRSHTQGLSSGKIPYPCPEGCELYSGGGGLYLCRRAFRLRQDHPSEYYRLHRHSKFRKGLFQGEGFIPADG